MSDIKRVMAEVVEITDKQPIEGADNIEVINIRGWQVVAQKGIHEIGNLSVYFAIDSLIPELPEFEWLRERCYVKDSQEGAGFRIKTIRLRGVYSQGILMPLSELSHYLTEEAKDGDDLTDILNVKKYEKKLPAYLAGRAKGNFPSFVPKTDEHRIQNFHTRFEKNYSDDEWEVSLKLDGSSMTNYYRGDIGSFGVCSRNLDLQETEDNAFWIAARKESIEEKLAAYFEKTGTSIAIQGELMGPGIQGNRENLKDYEYYVFNVWDIHGQRYFTAQERAAFLSEYNIRSVPVYDIASFNGLTVKDFLELAENGYGGKSLNHKIREGIVFKNTRDTGISFKSINNKFLLKEE